MESNDSPHPSHIQAGRDVEIEISGDFVGGNKILGDQINAATYIAQQVFVQAAEVSDIESLPPEPGEPPFKGLQHFTEADADLFFGREYLTAQLVGRLQTSHFLMVVGASGSGKSSLVRAGVIPALRRGERLADGTLPPAHSAEWPVHIITPSTHPLDSLANTLTDEGIGSKTFNLIRGRLGKDDSVLGVAAGQLLQKTPHGRLLLVVDQFEELFTMCRDEDERRAFIDNLLTAADPANAHPITIVATLRADFYAQCAQYDNLRHALENQQAFIGAMSRDELFQAIVRPAALGQWRLQEGLVELMLDEVGEEPGALPLLSHALLETWAHRRGRTMTLSGYRESGGVKGAIAKTAESIFRQRLTPTQQPIARMIFLRLTELGEGTQDTRRRIQFSELISRATDEATIETVLNILTGARLVVTGMGQNQNDETVEVAHEALIREWPTLRRWLDESRTSLRLHRQISEDAQTWLEHGRDLSFLYQGVRLANAREWLGTPSADELLNDLERDFLEESTAETERRTAAEQAAAEEKLRLQRRAALVFRNAAIVAGVLLVFALVATLLAWQSRNSALVAEADAQEARTQAETNLTVAITREAETAQALAEVERQSQAVLAQSLISQGGQIANRTNDYQLGALLVLAGLNLGREVDAYVEEEAAAETLREILGSDSLHLGLPFSVPTLDYHQPTQRFVVFSAEQDEALTIWQRQGQQWVVVQSIPLPRSGDGVIGANNLFWDPSGQYVAIMTLNEAGNIVVVEVESGAVMGWFDSDLEPIFSPTGQILLLLTETEWQLVDMATGQLNQLSIPTTNVQAAQWHPNGEQLLIQRYDAEAFMAELWDIGSGELVASFLPVPENGSVSMGEGAITPDGRQIVILLTLNVADSYETVLAVWQMSDLTAPPAHYPLETSANRLAFNPSGSWMAVSVGGINSAGPVTIWDTAEWGEPVYTTSVAYDIWEWNGWLAFIDEQWLLAGDEGQQHVWLIGDPMTAPRLLKLNQGPIGSLAYSADGQTLFGGIVVNDDAGYNPGIGVWDMANWRLAPQFHATNCHIDILRPMAGEQRLLVSFADSACEGEAVWDLADSESQLLTGYGQAMGEAFLSPNHWDLAEPCQSILQHAPLRPYYEARTGTVWLTETLEGEIEGAGIPEIVRVSLNPLALVPVAPISGCLIALSESGDWLVVGREAGIFLQAVAGHTAPVPLEDLAHAAFSPNGQWLAWVDKSGQLFLHDLATAESHWLNQNWPLQVPHLQQYIQQFQMWFKFQLAFSADGRGLLASKDAHSLYLWDTTQLDAPPSQMGGGGVQNASFSPDAQTLAIASQGQIQLWPYPLLDQLTEVTCQILLRDLTEEEWQSYLPNVPYRPTCE